MLKFRATLIFIALFATSYAFADMGMMSESGKACGTIADACKAAGFSDSDSAGKRFWQDCMEPIIMGKTVANVIIDAPIANTCRHDKIAELKKELQKLQKVKG